MTKSTTIERRSFLRMLAGGGLALAFGTQAGSAALLSCQDVREAEAFVPELWVTLLPSGEVKIVAHRSEMGTGIATSLPMVVADEMEADWARVTIEQAPGDARYGDQNTDGSRSVRQFYEIMRQVGAAMRQMLEQAAANRWGVPVSECKAQLHEVVHTSGKKLGYGELATEAGQLEKPAESELVFKKPSERRYQGKGVPIRDMEGILDGTAQYGADVRIDGMKYAVIARPPVLGATPTSFDRAAAEAIPGVEQVLEMDAHAPAQAPGFNPLGGVAVIASSTWAAMQGREALAVKWDLGPNAAAGTESQMEMLRASSRENGEIARKRGNAVKAIADAPDDKVIRAEYEAPYLAHASMEPPCAVAHVTEEGCHCWAPTQNPQAAQGTVAQVLNLPPNQVRVDVTLLGGGFGRKSKPDYVAEAAVLSKKIGAPVQVFWSREDDIRHDYYHSVSAMQLEAALGEDNFPTAWRARSSFPAIGTSFNPAADRGSGFELDLGFKDVPWDLPHIQVESGKSSGVVRVGWLRSVCNIFHAFAAHSFADELAQAAGMDSLEFLRKLIGPPRKIDLAKDDAQYSNYGEPIDKHPIDTGRMLAVLNRAAEMSGWGRRQLAPNRGVGIAVHRSFLAYVANVVEVEVAPNGRLSIERVDIACDAGTVLHEERVRGQMSGGVLFGLSAALHGNITVRDGAVVQSNFHDYPLLRMSEAPKEINVEILPSDAPPSGVGEAGTPPAAPALANAIYAASGHRLRRLPISGQNLAHG
ncbi:MAG: twin-arginine translocation pathway signal protein [Planctomycetes bacterium]|nr:twin-arginine translocation pathway signal protein [Planctomycetota bacterium]